MPLWSNNDLPNSKPKFDLERQVHKTIYLNTSTTLTSNLGNTVLFFNNSDVANANIQAGWSVEAANVGYSPIPGFFASNTTVVSTTANTVTISQPLTGIVPVSAVIEFDKNIVWKTNSKASLYNQNTVLVTNSRLANSRNLSSNTAAAPAHTGWVNVVKKTNNDGTVRYMTETLVITANSTASNTNSGNTSFSQLYPGV